MQKGLVSIVINCHNSARFLRETIDSILAQTYPFWEVVFYDNASADSTAEIIKSYNDLRFLYFYSETLVPLGKARNLALEKCKGEYIAFLDSDDLWLPGKLEKNVPLFEVDTETGLVYSDVLYFKNEGGETMQLYKYRKHYTGYCFHEMLVDYFLCISSCIIRRETLLNLDHWFNERLFVCEDPDLFLRLALISKCAFCPEVLTKYRLHTQSLTFQKRELFFTEMDLIIGKLVAIPEISRQYGTSLKVAAEKIILDKAKFLWKKKQNGQAMKMVLNNSKINLKSSAYLLLMLFPYSLINYIYSKIHSRKVAY